MPSSPEDLHRKLRDLREEVLEQVDDVLERSRGLSAARKQEQREKIRAKIDELQRDTFRRNELQSKRCCKHLSKLEEAGFTTVHLKRKEGLYNSQNLVEMREDLKGYAERIGGW